MKEQNIAILGAGIGGLCSAIALNKKGFNVTLYERSSKAKNIGAGLVLWPNATHILDKLDLLEAVKAAGFTLDIMQRYTEAGEFLNEIDLKKFEARDNYSNYSITRKSLQDILINHLNKNNIRINYNYCVTKIENQDKYNAIVHFQNHKTITADIIIAADGRMNSIARKYVIGNNQPLYQGYVNWVGIINTQSEIQFKKNILDYWGCGERFGIVPLSAHSAYWAGCKTLPEGLGEPEDGSKNTLLAIFKSWPDDIKTIIELSSEHQIKRIEVYDHDPITKWHRDNVCLIGDAAHAALPTSGQGACQAIEDAHYLAECLDSESNLHAFEQFYKLRTKITRDITQRARHLSHSIFNTDPEFCEARNQKARQQ